LSFTSRAWPASLRRSSKLRRHGATRAAPRGPDVEEDEARRFLENLLQLTVVNLGRHRGRAARRSDHTWRRLQACRRERDLLIRKRCRRPDWIGTEYSSFHPFSLWIPRVSITSFS
jgi:hypothetical protein